MHRRSLARVPLVALAACALGALVGCGDFGLDEGSLAMEGARIGIDPGTEILFPQTSAQGRPASVEAVISSDGDAPLEILSVSVEGVDGENFSIGEMPLPITLQPGATFPVVVEFQPDAEGQYSANLLVEHVNEQGIITSRRLVGQGCYDQDADGTCDLSGPEPVDTGDSGW